MADIVYVESGYTDAGYFVYTADAGAVLTSQSFVPNDAYIASDYAVTGYFLTPAISGTVIKSDSATITVVATTTIAGARTRSSSVASNNTVTVAVSAARQRSDAAALGIAVTQSVTATATKPSGANLVAFDTVAITALANKNFDADLASAFALSAQPSVTRDAGYPVATVTWDDQDSSWDDWQHLYWDPDRGIWTRTTSSLYAFPVVSGENQFLFVSEFVIYPNGGHFRTGSASLLENNSLLFAIGGYEKTTGATITVLSTVSAAPAKIHSTTSADLSSTIDFAADAQVIPPTRGQADLLINSTVSALGGPIKQFSSALASEFAFEATGRQPGLQDADAVLSMVTNQTTTANTTAGGTANVTVNSSQTATPTRLLEFATALIAQSVISIVPVRIRSFDSTLSLNTALDAVGINIRPGLANLVVNSQLSALAGYFVTGDSAFAVISQVAGTGTRRRNSTATISATGFVLTAGDVFTIDPDFQLVVQQETRFYPVLPELRLNTVTQETRVNTIWPESRGILVPQETRQETVI